MLCCVYLLLSTTVTEELESPLLCQVATTCAVWRDVPVIGLVILISWRCEDDLGCIEGLCWLMVIYFLVLSQRFNSKCW